METGMRKDLRIEKLVYRGDGLGYYDGKAVFVPLTVPGDVVSWEPLQEKKRYIRGRLVGVMTPSSDRVDPPCPAFGRCGGCQWQHVTYEGQLWWKRKIVGDILTSKAGIPNERIHNILPSPNSYHYRSRARLTWGVEGLGFRRAGSHRIVSVSRCPLLIPRLNELLEVIQSEMAATYMTEGKGELLLETGDVGAARAIFRLRSASRRMVEKIEKTLREAGPLAERQGFSLWLETPESPKPEPIAGDGAVSILPEKETYLRLTVPSGGFFQANLAQNRSLTALVLDTVEEVATERPLRILDLYCGMGNFSLPMAARGWQVTGVDDSFDSIETARRNAVANGIDPAEFICADAADYLAGHLKSGGTSFDVLVLDPPRIGARTAAEILAKLNESPEIIVYVSCDPMTLARDLKILTTAGYNVTSVTPVDMFPQTFHIETVTVLKMR